MMKKCLLFFLLLGAPLAARAQVDTVRASTLPGPQLAEKAYNAGLVSYKAQNYPAALANFGQALAARPDFAPAYDNRAATRLALKDYPAAEATLQHIDTRTEELDDRE